MIFFMYVYIKESGKKRDTRGLAPIILPLNQQAPLSKDSPLQKILPNFINIFNAKKQNNFWGDYHRSVEAAKLPKKLTFCNLELGGEVW